MSLRVNRSAAMVAACSGPRTMRSWLCEKCQPTFEPSDTAVSATVARIPAAPVDTWSFTLCGASPPNTVTALSRSEEHTSELQSQSNLVCRLLLEKKKQRHTHTGVCETL